MDYQKWLIKLLPYDFEILYKPGIDNKVADGFSRISHAALAVSQMDLFALMVPSVLQLQDIYKDIDESDELKKLLSEDSQSLAHKGYTIKERKLWYKNRVVLLSDSKFIPLILEVFHTSQLGGHSGV